MESLNREGRRRKAALQKKGHKQPAPPKRVKVRPQFIQVTMVKTVFRCPNQKCLQPVDLADWKQELVQALKSGATINAGCPRCGQPVEIVDSLIVTPGDAPLMVPTR